MKKQAANTIKRLEGQVDKLYIKINQIQDAQNSKENRKLLERCFRTRNNYSCPEKASDYWWLYFKVLRTGSLVTCLSFEIDPNGNIIIRPSAEYYGHQIAEYESITNEAFQKEWEKCQKLIRSIK